MQVDERRRRRRQTRDTSSSAAVTTTTDSDAAASRSSGLTETVPWPTEPAADGAVCRWRVGHSCHNARWLFLRFASTCTYFNICLSFCLSVSVCLFVCLCVFSITTAYSIHCVCKEHEFNKRAWQWPWTNQLRISLAFYASLSQNYRTDGSVTCHVLLHNLPLHNNRKKGIQENTCQIYLDHPDLTSVLVTTVHQRMDGIQLGSADNINMTFKCPSSKRMDVIQLESADNINMTFKCPSSKWMDVIQLG